MKIYYSKAMRTKWDKLRPWEKGYINSIKRNKAFLIIHLTRSSIIIQGCKNQLRIKIPINRWMTHRFITILHSQTSTVKIKQQSMNTSPIITIKAISILIMRSQAIIMINSFILEAMIRYRAKAIIQATMT